MSGLPAWFFGSAILYGLLGLLLGNIMGASGDHSQMPTHAHVMLIGWVSFAIFGMFYHVFPERARALPARLHFWLAQVSFLALAVGLFLIFSGRIAGEPIAAIASVAYLLSMLLFGLVVLPVLRRVG
jgi:hypothetical protein